MQRQVEFQSLLDDGHEYAGCDGDPHLTPDRILGQAEEALSISL